jgi:hypothetical protein
MSTKDYVAYIEDTSHPNPLIIVLIVICYIVVFYALYVSMLKPSPEGEWVDSDGIIWDISHCKVSNRLYMSSRKGLLHGSLLGHGVLFDDGSTGIWGGCKIEVYRNGGLVLLLKKIRN